MNSGRMFRGKALTRGAVCARTLVLTAPLSLWGGLNPERGEIIDRHHPQFGATVAGRVLVMPTARGSSSSSSTLAEAARLGTAPAAILLSEPDGILMIGAEVARLLYGLEIPIVVLPRDVLTQVPDQTILRVVAGDSGEGMIEE